MNHPNSMRPAAVDPQTTWEFLEEGVDHIMTKLHTGVSYSKVTRLIASDNDQLDLLFCSICPYTPLRTTIARPQKCLRQI